MKRFNEDKSVAQEKIKRKKHKIGDYYESA